MEFSFEDNTYNKFLSKLGIKEDGVNRQLSMVLIPFVICWIPMAAYTLFHNTFWTGDITTSFITHFDTQIRFLVSMPIMILAEKLVSTRLGRILNQFVESGIVAKEDILSFNLIIQKKSKLLKSNWTDLVIYLICYIHVLAVLFYSSENTSFLSWQLATGAEETVLNFSGKWSTFIGRPFVLFLLYQWLLRIFVWGNILRKVSKLNLTLYPEHPDLSGGLGFLGYAIRYFSPIAFAISAAIVGNMADFMLIEGLHLTDLKIPIVGYLIFMGVFFALPLLFFVNKMINAKEESVFSYNDFTNGMYRELRKKTAKSFDQVSEKDLDSVEYSAVSDYNAVVDNVIQMRFIPFKIRDFIPLWVLTALPFLTLVVMDIPLNEIVKNVISFLV